MGSIAAQSLGRTLTYSSVVDLRVDPENPRKHSRAQVRAIARSIDAFGFNAPILIDENKVVIAGHGRLEAAIINGMESVPTICLNHLSAKKARAYMLADNKLTDRSTWDDRKLAIHLKQLSEIAIDFDIDSIGFELPEIDFRVQSLDSQEIADKADEFKIEKKKSVSCLGDLWFMDEHRLLCDSALHSTAYDTLLAGEKAAAVFTDPPYNVPIDGHVCGSGEVKHREFAMASGEMTRQEFCRFLETIFISLSTRVVPGALIYSCMDWRHLSEMLDAGTASKFELLNLCIWVKSNGGMGSLYRSRHELVFVFRNGNEQHLNNVQLGRFGRNRTNVWNYPGANVFSRKGHQRSLDLHPTTKPIALVADAILDCTRRQELVLDPFVGSGTTLLAAERTGRRGYGIEFDPLYVDTTIRRWEDMTKKKARHASGATFDDLQNERRELT